MIKKHLWDILVPLDEIWPLWAGSRVEWNLTFIGKWKFSGRYGSMITLSNFYQKVLFIWCTNFWKIVKMAWKWQNKNKSLMSERMVQFIWILHDWASFLCSFYWIPLMTMLKLTWAITIVVTLAKTDILAIFAWPYWLSN